MSPDTASKTVIQPGLRAGRRSSGYRSDPVSPIDVRAVVDAAVLTGDSNRIGWKASKVTFGRLSVGSSASGASTAISRWTRGRVPHRDVAAPDSLKDDQAPAGARYVVSARTKFLAPLRLVIDSIAHSCCSCGRPSREPQPSRRRSSRGTG